MEHAQSSETQAFLSDVADEMDAAAAKLEASNGASTSISATRPRRYLNARFGSKVVYTACYTLSYGVCFPVFMACRYIPRNNQFVDGLVDGGHSASQAADKLIDRVCNWGTSQKTSSEESKQEQEAVAAGAAVLSPA